MDGTVVCAECGESTSATQELCPVCGAELPSEPDDGGSTGGTTRPSTGPDDSGTGPTERSSGPEPDRPETGTSSADASLAEGSPTDVEATAPPESDRRSDAPDSTSGTDSSQTPSSGTDSSPTSATDSGGSTGTKLFAAAGLGLLGAGLIALPIFLLSGRFGGGFRAPIRIAIGLQAGGGLLLFLAASLRVSGYTPRAARRTASFGLVIGILGTILIFLSV